VSTALLIISQTTSRVRYAENFRYVWSLPHPTLGDGAGEYLPQEVLAKVGDFFVEIRQLFDA
jgi:hypothetical protein